MITNTVRHLKLKAIGWMVCLLVAFVGLSATAAFAAPNQNPAGGSGTPGTTAPIPSANPSGCSNDNCDLITQYVNPLIDTLSAIFGLIAVVSIIIGGIQYSASEGDPQKASQAKNRIGKTLFAIIAYFFLFAFLQFIIRGGAFNRSS